MEHSLQAYLERRTSEELVKFLNRCMWLNQWEQYRRAVPEILAELQKRSISVPEQILSSWSAYLQSILVL